MNCNRSIRDVPIGSLWGQWSWMSQIAFATAPSSLKPLEVTMEIFCGLETSGHTHEGIGVTIRMEGDRLQWTTTTLAMLTRTYQRSIGGWRRNYPNWQGNIVLLRNLFVLRRFYRFFHSWLFLLVISKSQRLRWIVLFFGLNTLGARAGLLSQ